MERLPICGTCLSKYPDIRGFVYSPGATVGQQCADDWHKGPGYDPNTLHLTAFDEEFLAENHVSLR
jgi:hypothetical protein